MNKDLIVKEEEIKDIALMVEEEGQEEHLSQDELQIPFIKIAQKDSPQTKESKADYIKGIEIGDFFNTATNIVYGPKMKVQVLKYFRCFNIWEGKPGKGKFRGSMTSDEFFKFQEENADTLIPKGGDYIQTGTELRYTDTRNYLILLPDFPEEGVSILPLKSTGIGASKTWNYMNSTRKIQGKRAARYSTIWEIETVHIQDDYDYEKLSTVKALGWASPELIKIASSFVKFANDVAKNSDKIQQSEDSIEKTVGEEDFI